jgi:hypothetical protein
LFQISLENFFKIKFYLYHYLRLQSSEIEDWPYYELEYTVDNLKDFLEKKKKSEDDQNQEYKNSTAGKQKSNIGKSINTPKMPGIPKLNTPGIKMPKKI